MSPYALAQERVETDHHYPWRVLVCCTLLNRTGKSQVWPMFHQLFAVCPTPAAMLVADDAVLLPMLTPLGLQNRRMALLRRLTRDYVSGLPPQQCHGVGKYALDAWALFVEGRLDVDPDDHFLRPYWQWRTDGGCRQPWKGVAPVAASGTARQS